MSFEDMNKPELVKEARSLSQQVKLLEYELEQLKKASEPIDTTEPVQLPYKAVSIVCGPRAVARLFVLEFNENGDARVVKESIKEYAAPYKALHAADKLLNTEISRQTRVGEE